MIVNTRHGWVTTSRPFRGEVAFSPSRETKIEKVFEAWNGEASRGITLVAPASGESWEKAKRLMGMISIRLGHKRETEV